MAEWSYVVTMTVRYSERARNLKEAKDLALKEFEGDLGTRFDGIAERRFRVKAEREKVQRRYLVETFRVR